jgi:signal transduction histidine kinase
MRRTIDQVERESWPWWIPLAETVALTAVAGNVIVDHAQSSPRWPGLFALAAVAPWALELVGRPLPRLVTIAIVLVSVAVIIAYPVDFDIAPIFLIFLTAETAAVARPWKALVAGAASIALMVSMDAAGVYTGSVPWVLGIGLAWAGGFATYSQLRLLREARAAQAELAERAAADERQRIAREVHDVIAHSLAVTMLHLTGARLALQRDPKEAEAALIEAERLGRESLAEIRRTVGLLAPEGTGTGAPMPTAADIAELVREFEAAGLDVEFQLTGDPRSLPPAAGLALYRVVQESLANVVRHAPGAPTSISLLIGSDMVRLHVRNRLGATVGAPSADGGQGVRGMRERVTLLGGELRAGPDDGGWYVDVALPRAFETA